MAKRNTKPKTGTKRLSKAGRGLLPGEYLKEDLVTVRMDSMQAALFAPEKLTTVQQTRPGDLVKNTVVVEERYIITTHHRDGQWDYRIEHVGHEPVLLPGKALDKIIAHRKAIIKAKQTDQGILSAERRLRQTHQADQNAAAQETVALDNDEILRMLNAQG